MAWIEEVALLIAGLFHWLTQWEREMEKTTVERFIESDENRLAFERESAILQVTESICKLMRDYGVSERELARRLGKPRVYVQSFLAGAEEMTIWGMAGILAAIIDPDEG